jgi:polar amino acid transport system ATP-binding protein
LTTPSADTPVIAIHDLHKSYGNLEVLKGVDLVAPRGHLAALLQPSGGKPARRDPV